MKWGEKYNINVQSVVELKYKMPKVTYKYPNIEPE